MNRNTTRRGIIIVAAIMTGFLCLAASALASQTNIFGGPGTAATLAPNCARKAMFLTPAGKTWDGKGANGKKYVFAISTVLGTQIKCLIHRVDHPKLPKPDTCFAQAGPVPATAEAPADRQGYHDTQGLDALRAYVAKLAACEAAR